MPEGDTVWLAARRLHEALAGSEVTVSDFRVPQLATASVTGTRVAEVVPRGKHLLIRFDDGRTLRTHFRMDGTWHLHRPGARWDGGPGHAIRVRLATAGWDAVGYRLHDLALVPTARESELVGHLGPDLCQDDFDEAEALARLRARPDRAIGEALLDQRAIAGIGNLYKAESLFLAGADPWSSVGRADADGTLAAAVGHARRLLLRNRARPSQSTTGEEGRDRAHYVFERAGRPCRRCGTVIRRAAQGTPPMARITYWCPACQPAG